MNLPNRRIVLGFAGVLGLASLLLVLALGYTGSPSTQASNESADTAMFIVVNGMSGGDPVSCDSNSDAACSLDPDSSFTVEITPKAIPVGGYSFWQTLVEYGSLNYKPTAAGTDEITWDETFLPLRSLNDGSVGHGDVSAFFAPFPRSPQKTALVTLAFNCGADGTGDALTLIDFGSSPAGTVYGGESGEDTIIPAVGSIDINCEPPPPTPTATPPPPTATPCPSGKVPVNGGCGTPTDTPEASPTPTVTPTPENVCGDIDGDQSVSSVDSLWALWWVADLVDDVPVEKAGDVNGDDAITSLDATLILQFEASLIDALLC